MTLVTSTLRSFWAPLRRPFQHVVDAGAQALLTTGRFLAERIHRISVQLHRVGTGLGRLSNDRLRQGLNVVLATTQYLAPFFAAVTGIGVDIATRSTQGAPLAFAPADYTYGIWAYLYPACIAYAVYQALPGQRERPLLRRVGGYMALAFAANTLWALAAQLATPPWYWLTVLFITVMLLGLVGAFVAVLDYRLPLSQAERYLVATPISVFAAWITLATVVNAAAMLQLYGFSGWLLSDTAWAIVMTVVAGVLGAAVTRASRGNTAYALTIVWALVGLAVGALRGGAGIPLAFVAAAAAGGVLVTWGRTRWGRPSRSHPGIDVHEVETTHP